MRKLLELLRGLLASWLYGLAIMLAVYGGAVLGIGLGVILWHSLQQLVHIFEGAQ